MAGSPHPHSSVQSYRPSHLFPPSGEPRLLLGVRGTAAGRGVMSSGAGRSAPDEAGMQDVRQGVEALSQGLPLTDLHCGVRKDLFSWEDGLQGPERE